MELTSLLETNRRALEGKKIVSNKNNNDIKLDAAEKFTVIHLLKQEKKRLENELDTNPLAENILKTVNRTLERFI